MKIENFIKIIELDTNNISSDIVKVNFIDYNESDINNTSSTPELSMQLYSEETKIDKEYNENTILKEFIDKVIEISEPETYNDRIYEHKTNREIKTYMEAKQLMHRMISCGSYISANGRFGPAQFVLVPYLYYEKLIPFIQDGQIGAIEIFPTNLIKDIMIFGRKNDQNLPGIFLFLDKERNKYKMKDIGTAKHQYHILKVWDERTYLQNNRRKKIEQIENNKY